MNFKVRKIDDIKQKGLVATKNIKKGTLIFEQRPIAHVLSDSTIEFYCSNCSRHGQVFEDSIRLSRCSNCKVVRYCSRECQAADWRIHKYECICLKKARNKERLLPSFVRLLIRFLVYCDSEGKDISNSNFIPENWKIPDILERDKESFVAPLHLLKLYTDGVLTLPHPSLLIRICFYLSVHCITITSMDLSPIGTGLYHNLSFANNSCYPNCMPSFSKRGLSLKAIKELDKDEEITIGYIDLLLSVEERRSALEKWGFACRCDRCEIENRLLKDKVAKVQNSDIKYLTPEKYGFRCPSMDCCGTWWIPEDFVDTGLRKGQQVNLECKTCTCIALNFEKTLAQYKEAQNTYEKAYGISESDPEINGAEFLKLARNSTEQFRQILADLDNRLLKSTKLKIEALCLNGQWEEALELCSELIRSYRQVLPQYHPIIGIQMYMAARICNWLEQFDQSTEFIRGALKILQISYGEEHPMVQKLFEEQRTIFHASNTVTR